MVIKRLVLNFIIFLFFIFSCHAQVSAKKTDEQYFQGKWYLIAKGMPQGDARMIMSIKKEEEKLSGTITSPIDPSQLFTLQDITISGNQLWASCPFEW